MSYIYPTKSMASHPDTAMITNSQYFYDEASMTWVALVDNFESQLWGQFDSENQLSTHLDLRVHTNLPSHYTDNASPSEITSPSSQSSSSSTSPMLAPKSRDFTITRQESSTCDKKKRRRIQNRDSQRAYRERSRQKESEMNSVIMKLQREIEELRAQEKSSGEIIQALSEEIERLRNMGLAFQWTGI